MEPLLLSKIKDLQGKKIRVQYSGYRGQDGDFNFIVGDVISHWDLAKEDETAEGFQNRQEYWKSYFTASEIKEMKSKIALLDADRNKTHVNAYDNEGIFWCSDSDRYVSYELIEQNA